MNNIQLFNNPQFGQIRVAQSENGEPLFCLTDVCNALEISNSGNVKTDYPQRVSAKWTPLRPVECNLLHM